MSESRFIQRVHRQLPQEVYRWKIKDDFAGGVPDAWYCGPAGSLFIEYKYVKALPKRTSTKVRAALSELQQLWIRERTAQNQVCWVVVGSPAGAVIYTDVGEAVDGITVAAYTARVLETKELARTISAHCLGHGHESDHGSRQESGPEPVQALEH